jgi:pyruvate/2-oxoglutarate/acetoin dehydrogenase E1 component
MARIKYRDALRQAIREEMIRDPAVFCIGEGIALRGGSYKVTLDLYKEFGLERVIDTPIAEASFIGMATGAAIIGMRPIAEILFIDFACLAMDQIVNQAAKYRFMSGDQGRVPLVLRTQGGVGNGLAGQHSQSLEAFYYHTPGLIVVMPSTPYDAKGLLKTAVRHDDPVIFIEHKLLYMTEGDVPEEEYLIPFGQADVKREGEHVTLVTYSNMTLKCLEAADILASEGIFAEVIDLRTLTPLDKACILESVKKTGRLVIAQEACKRGGVGGDIAAMVIEEAFDYLDAPIMRIAGRNTTIPFNLNLEKVCVPSVGDVVMGVREIMAT